MVCFLVSRYLEQHGSSQQRTKQAGHWKVAWEGRLCHLLSGEITCMHYAGEGLIWILAHYYAKNHFYKAELAVIWGHASVRECGGERAFIVSFSTGKIYELSWSRISLWWGRLVPCFSVWMKEGWREGRDRRREEKPEDRIHISKWNRIHINRNEYKMQCKQYLGRQGCIESGFFFFSVLGLFLLKHFSCWIYPSNSHRRTVTGVEQTEN